MQTWIIIFSLATGIAIIIDGHRRRRSKPQLADAADTSWRPSQSEARPLPAAKLYLLHKSRCDAAAEALQEDCLLLRLVHTQIDWASFQSSIRGEHMVYDAERGVYHASDTAGDPSFSLASPIAPGTLPGPTEAEDNDIVSALLLMLPAAEPNCRASNFQRMTDFAFSLMVWHGGRLLDNSGSAATRHSLEHTHERLLEDARKASVALTFNGQQQAIER